MIFSILQGAGVRQGRANLLGFLGILCLSGRLALRQSGLATIPQFAHMRFRASAGSGPWSGPLTSSCKSSPCSMPSSILLKLTTPAINILVILEVRNNCIGHVSFSRRKRRWRQARPRSYHLIIHTADRRPGVKRTSQSVHRSHLPRGEYLVQNQENAG